MYDVNDLSFDQSLDLDQYVEKFYDEFEHTQRVFANAETITESKMEVKKIIFKKQYDIISKYDKALVLKNFVKE